MLAAAIFLPTLPRAHAQDAFLQATVPFDFAVGNTKLPAGEYRFSHDGSSLRILNRNTQAGLYIIQTPGDASQDRQARLLFEQKNGIYFLKNVVARSSFDSSEFPASRLHRKAGEMPRQPYAVDLAR
jgi:hypothetical protein